MKQFDWEVQPFCLPPQVKYIYHFAPIFQGFCTFLWCWCMWIHLHIFTWSSCPLAHWYLASMWTGQQFCESCIACAAPCGVTKIISTFGSIDIMFCNRSYVRMWHISFLCNVIGYTHKPGPKYMFMSTNMSTVYRNDEWVQLRL